MRVEQIENFLPTFRRLPRALVVASIENYRRRRRRGLSQLVQSFFQRRRESTIATITRVRSFRLLGGGKGRRRVLVPVVEIGCRDIIIIANDKRRRIIR